MHYFDEYKIDELLFDYFEKDKFQVVEETLEYINFINRDNVEIIDFDKHIFLKGDYNENYCKEEIEIFACVNEFKLLERLSDTKSELYVFEAKLEVDSFDFDYFASAIIKIIDKAFKKPILIFCVNNNNLLIGTNTPLGIDFKERFLITKSLERTDYRSFIVWFYETLLYDLDCIEIHYSLVEYILNECGIFDTHEDYSGPISFDEIRHYMKLFFITFNYHLSEEIKEANTEYNRVINYQKKYKLLTKELAFIKYCNENSYEYIRFLKDHDEEQSTQLDIFEPIDDVVSDELDAIIEKLDDEDFDDPIYLIE